MDYNALVADANTTGSIKRAINWSRVDSVGILDEAQTWIYARLRVREMQSRADVTIALNATSATLPTRYLDPIKLSIPGYISRIRPTDLDRWESLLPWNQDGTLDQRMPTRYCVFDEVINFNSRSDAAYTAKFLHFKQPAALSASNTTNFLTTRYPTLLRRVCLMFAAEERKDRQIMNESETRALAMIDDIKKEADLQFRGMEADFNWGEESEDVYG
jgi:hypothetical protein